MNRHLILNCDDFGQSLAANAAIMHLLEERKVSSATIMPPAPSFDEAAAWVRRQPDPRVGLHLTLTSEFPGHRWASLTGHPSLHDDTGHMHLTAADFEKHADPKAVRAEINAQFDLAKYAGLPITHADNHMGSLYGIETGRSYLPYVFWQCGRRGLPFRIFRHIHPQDAFLNSIAGAEEALTKAVALADTLGVAMPDYLLTHPYHMTEGETYDSFKSSLLAKIYELPEGVSETYIHPAAEDAHMASIVPSWSKRVWEYRLMQDDDFSYALMDAGVQLIDYRYVRENLRRSRLKSAWSLFRLL